MKKMIAAQLWREYIEIWLDMLRAAGQSAETVATRRRQIGVASRGLGGSPLSTDRDRLLEWFAAQEWMPETRKGYRAALTGFFGWLRTSGRRQDDPSDVLPSVRRPKAHPRPCPDRVIIAAMGRATPAERLMIRLGCEAGLRRSEIAAVHSRDVTDDLVGKSLIVRGKGDRQRIVPLPGDLAQAVLDADGYLFPGRWGGHVEKSYVGRHLSRLLGRGWGPHSLRHRYTTRMYESTGDLYVVAELLGHESVETTQRYVAMPSERLRAGLKDVILEA